MDLIRMTDVQKTYKNGVVALYDFDLKPNEFVDENNVDHGDFGPYKQSLRKEIYESYAKYLLEIGKAYPCFASAEELDEMRAKQEAAKIRPGYYGIWAKYRTLPIDEAAERIKNGETLDDLLPEAFATVREASKRVLGMRHFDVQLIGGIILHQGRIAEMRTALSNLKQIL